MTIPTDFLKILSDELYTDLVLQFNKRVYEEELIKDELVLALYKAYKYGRDVGWVEDHERSKDD